MADPRFFKNHGPFTLAELAKVVGATLSDGADPSQRMADVAPIDVAGPDQISFLDNPKYTDAFSISKAGAALVHPKHASKAPKDMALLLTEEPYLGFALVARKFYPIIPMLSGVLPGAHVDPTAILGEGVGIATGAWIGPNVTLGANVQIGPNAVIMGGVTIGDDTHVGANVSISHSLIGKRVIIHPNVAIGQDGFGFAKGPKGAVKVPQLGRVIIEDDVEIGAGSCVDRGAGPDTVIGMGTKIDNLVQIGHNARVGRFVTIVSQVGISGSSEVGDGAVIAGQVGVAGHIRVGQRAVIAARSGVTKSVPDGQSYGGFPAVPIMEWRRQQAALTRLTKKKDVPSDD